jgi:excisionase family DNA binding protein
VSIKEAAAALGLGESTTRRLVAARKLGHRRLGLRGGKIDITRSDIDDYLEACRRPTVVEIAPGERLTLNLPPAPPPRESWREALARVERESRSLARG